jgi:hypothetical protein
MQELSSIKFPRQVAILVLASATALPVWAQQSSSSPQQSSASSASQTSSAGEQQPSPAAQKPLTPAKEGFWGRINPMARKKWVKKQTDPINDRLTELDEVNARNARDIKDVDGRAQAGIQKAQASADAANQTAQGASQQAASASSAAQQASGHVEQLNTTVNGLDQYRQISDLQIKFRGMNPVLTAASKAQLDQLAASITGHEGYIVEMEAQTPAAGSAGIQSSQRMAEAVERYLVTEHQVPIYRMHFVALGNAQAPAPGDEAQNQKPERVRVSSVHLRLMENSLAAQAESSPQNGPAGGGAEQP